jgi:hypothetical protein
MMRSRDKMHPRKRDAEIGRRRRAREIGLNDAHVRRILRFRYLARDIVEAIIEGRQPRSMTVKRLLQGIPCIWADQRAAFGFARSIF